MSPSIDFDQIEIRKLQRDSDLSKFDCSFDDDLGLNVFIHDQALSYQENLLGITYLFYYRNNIVGFVTLAMNKLTGKHVYNGEKIRLRYYPALLIGRLAVDNNFREMGIGTFICDICTGYAENMAKYLGCKFLVLDTNEGKRVFYEKCGFQCVKEEDRIIMFKKIETDSFEV